MTKKNKVTPAKRKADDDEVPQDSPGNEPPQDDEDPWDAPAVAPEGEPLGGVAPPQDASLVAPPEASLQRAQPQALARKPPPLGPHNDHGREPIDVQDIRAHDALRAGVHLVRSPRSATKYGAKRAQAVSNGSPAVMENTSRYMRVTTFSTRYGSAVMHLVSTARGDAPYVIPLIRFLDDPRNAAIQAQTRIDEIGKRRHPQDPTSYLSDPPKKAGGYSPPYYYFMVMMNNPDLNTPANRTLAAEALIRVNNSRAVQTDGYGNSPETTNPSNMMVFAGDITPSEGLNSAPWPSDYCTIGDLMQYIAEQYTLPDGTKPTDAQMVQDQTILDQWFNPNLHDRLRELYAPNPNGENFAPGFHLPNLEF